MHLNERRCIEVDGSRGEGGGQILRSSLALSLLTGLPFRITRIRAKRKNPGLATQHAFCARAAAQLGGGSVVGAEVGSREVSFDPRPPRPGTHEFRIPTAGAATLLLQTIALPLAALPQASVVTVVGGTHLPHAPSREDLVFGWAPWMTRLGFPVEVEDEATAGYFPKGGGSVVARLGGASIGPLAGWPLAERGRLSRLRVSARGSRVPEHVMERMAAASVKSLSGYAPRVESEALPVRALDPGASLCVVAEFQSGPATFSALGERGVPSEEVARRAVRDFERFFASGAAVERHLADQILLPVGWLVAGGRGPLSFTTSAVTEHLVTHAWVLELFLPLSIRIEGEVGQPGGVTVAPAGG